MRDKYYINLNDKEYFDALSSLVSKRNKLIQSGITMTYTYPTPTVIDTFYTDANGCFVTPEKLDYGKGYSNTVASMLKERFCCN